MIIILREGYQIYKEVPTALARPSGLRFATPSRPRTH
jgi:hypothetical protein